MNLGDGPLSRLQAFLSEGLEEDVREARRVVGERRISRYRLTEFLGEGGAGVVFRAHDEALGRDVAIKTLKTVQSQSPVQVERFRREMKNAARLAHPNIVAPYDAGCEGDTLYYTMELVIGKPMDRVEGDLATRVAILEKVARAVEFAHGKGVLHRDLKPANILVDDRHEPHLLDFGLSRDQESASDLSCTGGLLGTPRYMPPEQARGRVHEIDARSDVYALGVILYEILAGRVPFDGESIAEVVSRTLSELPAPPAGPEDLRTICLKSLEKEPGSRYESAAAFAEELARFREGRPILARPAGLGRRAREAFRRHRGTLGVAVGLFALASSAGVLVARSTIAPSSAEAPVAARPRRATRGLQALYTFREGEGKIVRDISGVDPPLHLTVRGKGAIEWRREGGLEFKRDPAETPAFLVSEEPATRFLRACRSSGALSLEAWIVSRLPPSGTRFFLSFSDEESKQGASLGVTDRGRGVLSYGVKLFTSQETLRPEDWGRTAASSVAPPFPSHVVFTRQADGAMAVYVNGQERRFGRVSGDFSNWLDPCRLVVGAGSTDGERPWFGTIHLVAMYDRALEPREVFDNYEADRPAMTSRDPRAIVSSITR